MKRGDVITVAVSGDYGKPRPAVVIQSDELPSTDSVLVCQITSVPRDASKHRLPIERLAGTGLRTGSFVMVEKIVAVKREKCGRVIGHLPRASMRALNPMLAFVMGLSD
jgi:mRNA interferase MazF